MTTFKISPAGILSLFLCSIGLSAPPSAPQNIQQAWLATESLLLWDETPSATSYNVYRADETNTTWTLVGSSSVPRFRDPTLQFLPSFYVVTAVNPDGESSGSEASTVAFAEGYTISVYEPQQWQGTLSPTNALLQLITSDPNGGQGLIDWGLDPTNFIWFAMDTNYLAYHWFSLTNLSPRTSYFYRLTSITSNRAGVSYLGYFQTPDTNHPPVAEDFTAWWPVPTNGGWILLHGYDSNEPLQSLTFRIVGLPTNGTLSEIQSGWSWNEASVVYTPVPGARGYDYFRFVVNNGTWDSAPGLVTLTNWYNTPPATTNGLLTTPEDTPLAFTIPNFDAEGDPVTFDISPWAVWNGTISGTPPNLVFTPATNFNGTTWFSYQVSDGYEQVWGWYQIDVTPVNDKPVIMTNFLIGASTWEDQPTTLWLPIFDVEWNSTYELIVVTPPLHGTVTGDAWNIVYMPETNFFGTDYFTIAVREPDGTTSDPVTLPIQVQSMDDAPIAFNQSVTVFEDTPQVIVPTAFDVEGDPLTFQVVQYPNNGWVEQNGTNFIYHPMTNFIGQDAFSFRAVDSIGLWSWDPAWIQIQVVDANDAAIASYTHHNLHTDIIVARPFNVTDLDGDTMTCEVVQPPLQGTVTIDGTNFTYTPGPGLFDYEDSFTYRVSDGLAYGNEALVTLWIGQTNSLPVAQDQSVDTIRNQTLSFQLSIQDANGEETPVGLLEAAPTNGTVELTTNGYAIYTPANEFIGTDTFTYRPYDGFATGNLATVTISVTPQNRPPTGPTLYFSTTEDAPKALDVSMTDPDGDALTYSTVIGASHGSLVGTFPLVTYVPNTNFSGTDYILYWAFDGQAHSLQTWIIIDVSPVNDAPVANPGSVTVAEDNSVAIPLTGSDVDGDALTVIIQTNPSHGTLTNQSGTYRYFPATNFNGSDSFVFRVSDGSLQSADATVSITVTPVNDAPVRVSPDRGFTISEDWYREFDTQASDADGDVLTYRIVTQPSHGTMTKLTSNTWRYQPAWNWYGDDLLTWVASDGQVDSAIGTVWFHVTSQNDRPLAGYDSLTNAEDTAFAVTLWSGDVDGDALSYIIVTPPTNGVLSGSGSNRIYTPNPNFVGSDSLVYKVNDGQLDSFPGTILFTVTNVNDAPVANALSVTTAEDTAVNVTLTGSDVDGDALTYSIVSSPSHGSLNGAAPNLTYTPAADYFGSDSFVFSVSDGITNSTATVSITVTAVNDLSMVSGLRRRILDGVVQLWWNAVPGAASYNVYRADETNGVYALVAGGLAGTNYSDAGALFQHTYHYYITTSDGAAESGPSNPVLARPDDTGLITLNVESWIIRALTAQVQFCFSLNTGGEGLWEYGTTTNYGAVLENTNLLGCQHFTLSNLTPQTVYYYRLTATDSNGNAIVYWNSFATDGAPVADAQSVSTAEDNALNIIVSGHNANFGPYLLTYSIVNNVSHGTLSSTGPNAYRYTPTTNYNGADSFTFKVNNGELDSAPATVSITVTPVNDLPLAANITRTVPEDTSVSIPASFTDVDGGPVTTVSIVSAPAHGSAGVSGTNLLYLPATNYFGADSFTYRVSDGFGFGNTATVSITVTNVEDSPIAFAQSVATAEDVNKAITLAGVDPDGDSITFSIYASPTHGTLIGTAPNVTYRPATNYNGADSFAFRVYDGKSFSVPATVSITVTPVNDRPVANSQAVTVAEDGAISIIPAGSDVDQEALTFAIATAPAHGSILALGPTTWSYTPSANYNGPDSFTFVALDAVTSSVPATVSITVTPVNDAPVASPQSLTLAEDTSVTFALSGSDVDGDALSFQVATSPTNGTLNIAGTNLTYIPATNYHGGDSFTFRAFDGTVWSAPATVTLTVTSVDDAPVAFPQSVTVAEDGSQAIVLAGFDGDGEALTYSIVAQPAHGVLSGTPPNVTYQPAANYNGPDSFTFRVTDGNTFSAPATVSITVTAVNDAPVANNGTVTLAEDTTANITLIGTDVEGGSLTFTVWSYPQNGTITGAAPNLVYTPDANFNGTNSLQFIVSDGALLATGVVTIIVTPVNDAPVVTDRGYTVNEDWILSAGVITTDIDGDPLTYRVVTPPLGSLNFSNNGSFTYRGPTNYNGTDSFTFVANDGTTDGNIGTVTITLIPQNDMPYVTNQTVVTPEDTSVAITPLAGDVDGDPLTFTVFTNPGQGSVSWNGSQFIYTPATNYHGADSFQYQAHDPNGGVNTALVTIDVQSVNDAPVAQNRSISTTEDNAAAVSLIGSDVDGDALTYRVINGPANGTLSGTAPNLVYTPNANFNGSDSFTYTVNDGTTDGNTATVSISVSAVNDAPVAAAQSVTLSEDGSLAITLSGSDVENSPLTFAIVVGPAHGTLSGSAPNVVYTPAANYNGPDSFTFRVNDGTTNSAPATVSITVSAINDAPIANGQTVATAEDSSVAITLSGSDVDGDALSFAIVSAPTHGTLSGAAPNLTYTPSANYNGADSFTFRVNDGTTNSAVATVNINVTAVNDAPTANGQSVTVAYNTATGITLTGSDVEGSPLTYTIVNEPTNGALSGTAPNLTYTPNVGSAGADFFTFRVNDGAANSPVATVSITTQNPGSIPAAPSSLVVTVPTATGTLNLSWNDNSTNEDGFKIERSPNGNNSWAQIATVGINVHAYTNSGLSSNTRYYYRVRAYNLLGNSAYSNTANAKTR